MTQDQRSHAGDEEHHSDVDPSIPSVTRSAEDVARDEQEAGRRDTGTQGPTNRPTGTSTARDYTGIDPKDPIDGGSPAG